jgi:hypothetical protein
MECGSQDLVCQVFSLFEESEALGGGLSEILGRLGQNASGIVGALAWFLQNYGQAFFGLLGFTFGFWRWWRYRERILHERLAKYINESDGRLDAAHSQLLNAIQRPGPSYTFSPPLFSDYDLRSVLRETRWDRTPLALTVARSADAQLSAAIDRTTRRLEAAINASVSLQKQLVAAHTLRGAIAASGQKTPTQGEFALACFRNALRIPLQKASVFAKELEAHQLRKLGHFDRAAEAYWEMLGLTNHLDARQQAILNGRAKRYLAEITQAMKILDYFARTEVSPASQDAVKLLKARAPDPYAPGTLVLRDNFEPYREWDLIESAEISYFASFASALLGRTLRASRYLDDAISAYQGVLDDLANHGWAYRSTRKNLKARAENGLRRAIAARSGDYDISSWLVPSLTVEQTQEIAARIRTARGKQTVAKAS